jgi:hypothetical protein
MDCYAEDGIPMQPSDPPPHEPAVIEPVGSGLQAIKLQLQRSLVPSATEPGRALWRRLAPCGHMLHDHCAINTQHSTLNTQHSSHSRLPTPVLPRRRVWPRVHARIF